jgi:hypothetical protein
VIGEKERQAMPKRSDKSSEEKSAGYEVGHGKPPKHSQFKPGQSGNPKGTTLAAQVLKTITESKEKRK